MCIPCHTIDAQDSEGWADCFTADGIFDFDGWVIQGRPALRELGPDDLMLALAGVFGDASLLTSKPRPLSPCFRVRNPIFRPGCKREAHLRR